MTKTVGARELKTRLGTYLRLVREGVTIIVTDRGRPVAELRPWESSRYSLDDVIDDMIVMGAVSRQTEEPFAPFEPVRVRGSLLSRTLVDDREERF